MASRCTRWFFPLIAMVVAPAAGAAPGWNAAGMMAQGRYLHTATLLPDGRVLMAGGPESPAAELYDPRSGGWSAAGAAAAVRDLPTATLLASGEVLLVGGGAAPEADLYDPVSNRWRATGALHTNRTFHSAVLLRSGKVLVSGGWVAAPPNTHFTSAELHDPASGTFTATGSMAAGRRGHVSVLLRSGKVLVAGGTDGEALTSAELYDPDSGQWTATGSLAMGRGQFGGRIAAVLLDSGEVFIPGPGPSEIYNPGSGTWRTGPAMAESRIGYTATKLPSGRVLVTGGNGLTSAEIFDPATSLWSPAGNMRHGRTNHAAAALADGRVLVSGGGGSGSPLTSADLFEDDAPPPDAGAPDAPRPADAAPPPDARAATDTADPAATGGGGCTCRVQPAGRDTGGLGLLLVWVLLTTLSFRTRRRSG